MYLPWDWDQYKHVTVNQSTSLIPVDCTVEEPPWPAGDRQQRDLLSNE